MERFRLISILLAVLSLSMAFAVACGDDDDDDDDDASAYSENECENMMEKWDKCQQDLYDEPLESYDELIDECSATVEGGSWDCGMSCYRNHESCEDFISCIIGCDE